MAIVEETIVTPQADEGRSYVDWSAIFAGAAVAAAISLVLLTFGAALGLSLVMTGMPAVMNARAEVPMFILT